MLKDNWPINSEMLRLLGFHILSYVAVKMTGIFCLSEPIVKMEAITNASSQVDAHLWSSIALSPAPFTLQVASPQ